MISQSFMDRKEFGFRGATLHGLNQIILDSGLSVDYNIVSEQAEQLRLGLTEADRFEMDFEVEGSESSHFLPPIKNERILSWFRWLQPLSSRLLPRTGAFYVLVAKKRVSLITPIRPRWRPKVRQLVPVPMPQTNRTRGPDPAE